MTSHFFYNGVDLGDAVVRLGSITGLTEQADQGQMGVSSLSFDDPTGDGAAILLPLRAFQMTEDASADVRAYSGYSTQRTYERADSLRTGAAERITVQFVDLNASFMFKVIHHGIFHYKRPAETDIERITWLRSTSAGLLNLSDNGLIDTANPVNLSAVDYTGQFPLQVMQDCADLSGKNFFCYIDPASGEKSLAYFKSRDASFYPSTLSISNVLSDLSSTCFAPAGASLERDPSEVYDGVLLDYSGGQIYQRASGAILPRDTIAPSSNTSSRTVAQALATKFLAAAALEAERVTCTIRLPASQVNLLKHGMMVNARFTYMDGWDPGIDVRVLQRSLKQDTTNPDFYDVEVVLGHSVITNFTIGPGGDNSRVWPSDQPPFVPGETEPFVFVQSAKTADDAFDHVATFDNPTVAGNLLVGVALVATVGSTSATFGATWPAGWIEDVTGGAGGLSGDNRLQFLSQAHKEADGTEATIDVDFTLDGTGALDGYVVISEYTGDSNPAVISTSAGTYQSAIGTADVPEMPTRAGAPNLVVWAAGHEPNYVLSGASAGLTIREDTNMGGFRQAIALVDSIIASGSGDVNGTLTSPGGTDDFWWITGVTYASDAGSPSIGQPVTPESAISDGSRVIYQTNYPYIPGSLVVKVNGVVTAVDETDPPTGTFTLPAPPAAGAVITWTYNVADPTPTGANNPPPDPSGPGVPPTDGTVQGGDGVYRQPQVAFVPAETPDGVITVFTIPPYIAGSTLVYINGLIQRVGIDYTESSPGTGAITFTSAPWTGAEIIIVAMPVAAAPPPTGARPVTWGPPVTSGTVVIPGSIDPTGATDVAAAINAWVASVPDGRILDFDGGTFKLTQGIQIQNRHNLVLWGNGATLNVDSGASGSNQLSSPIVLGHAFGGSWGGNNTDIAIHDFTIVGNDPTPGTFTPGTESESNLELTWSTRVEVYDITGSAAYGDFATFDRITDVWLHDCHAPTAGRNGVSVLSGTRILVETSDFDVSGFCTFDVEPNDASQACNVIEFRNNTAQTWGNLFFAMEGSHTGAPIHTVKVTGNTVSTDSLETIVDNGGTSRMTNVSFTNNVSLGGSVAGPVLDFRHVDGLTVTGNVQTHSGALLSTPDCTGVVT